MSTGDENPADYNATSRDVIIGDRTNSSLANRLLCDFAALHHQLGHVQEATLKETSQRLVTLMKNGMDGVNCLSGKGEFVEISNASSVVASDDDAVNFVNAIIVEAMLSPVEGMASKDIKEDTSKYSGKAGSVTNSATDEDEKGVLDHASRPDEYDVWIPDDQKRFGNTRFYDFVRKCIDDEVVTITSPSSARVKATILAMGRTKTVENSTHPARFMRRRDDGSWTVLDDQESAEFVLCFVVDTLISKRTVSTFAPAGDLKSLIPSIGMADLSQFQDFSKPSTTPVQEPTEFDVLFGRGGMTNSHTGNKRFRDIISLHRPDYVRAPKIQKPFVAKRIVAAIRGGDPPGRFMKRNPTDLMWYDVGNRHAAEKTSQALRERYQAEKNSMTAGTSEADVRKRLLEQALNEARATCIRLSNDGGSQFGTCLDPNTFKLLVPTESRIEALDGVGLNLADESSVSTSRIKDNEVNRSDGKKSPGGAALHHDLNGETVFDTRVPSDPSLLVGPVDENGDIVVTENDILCGRGGLTNHHKGNKRFRDVVALHRADYVRAVKIHKPNVARMIVKAIRNSDPPGRFLRKDATTNRWVEIGDRRAAEKASQALREKPQDERANGREITPEETESNSQDDVVVDGNVDGDVTTANDADVLNKEAENGSSKLSGMNGEKHDLVQTRSKRVNTDVPVDESGKVSKIRCDT